MVQPSPAQQGPSCGSTTPGPLLSGAPLAVTLSGHPLETLTHDTLCQGGLQRALCSTLRAARSASALAASACVFAASLASLSSCFRAAAAPTRCFVAASSAAAMSCSHRPGIPPSRHASALRT